MKNFVTNFFKHQKNKKGLSNNQLVLEHCQRAVIRLVSMETTRGETEWEELPKSRRHCPGVEERILAPRAQLKSDYIAPGGFTHQKAG